jgi:hypothetical protein
LTFEITAEDQAKINKWLMEEVYPPIIAEQRLNPGNFPPFIKEDWDAGYPYQGASGGAVTYEFTPTSIGVVFRVKAYGQELDLTDYGSW